MDEDGELPVVEGEVTDEAFDAALQEADEAFGEEGAGEENGEETFAEDEVAPEEEALEEAPAEDEVPADEEPEEDPLAEPLPEEEAEPLPEDNGEDIAPEASPEEEIESMDEDEEPDGLEEVSEHLKDAVEGSLRLKRYLSLDEEDENGQPKKKRKLATAPEQLEAKKLLAKWGIPGEAVCLYILEQLPMEELQAMIASPQKPNVYNQWRTVAEMVGKFVLEQKERKLPGGGALDHVSAFRSRWKLGIDADKKLRALNHKDLRYVIDNYDAAGFEPEDFATRLDDIISEASGFEPEDSDVTENAIPTRPGAHAMSRFGRLELIDPLSDAAVFGDANLTFCLKFAAHRKALGHVGRVIATTFEDLETLRARYKEIDDSIATLEDLHCEVYHGVDCTRIALNPQFEGLESSLGAVYYNFPHSGAVQGFFDGHPIVNWRHENLMRLFFRALRSFMKPGGIVKVASNMGATGVRYSYVIGSAIENEFVHTETMMFIDWHLHKYGRSYGDKRDVYKRPDAKNNQSYNAQRAEADMVYCFRYHPTGDKLGPQNIRLPPRLSTIMACADGPFKHMVGMSPAKKNLAKQLHKRFVTEISGVHVG